MSGPKRKPDAPCTFCGKVGHLYAKGLCRSCYSRMNKYGTLVPQPTPSMLLVGVTRNGWTRTAKDWKAYFYKCAKCGAVKIAHNPDWPRGKCKCIKDAELDAGGTHSLSYAVPLPGEDRRETLKRYIWANQDKLSCKTIMRREGITREELDELYTEAIEQYRTSASKHGIIGNHYGAWEVIDFADSEDNSHSYLCRCKCGTTRIIPCSDLYRHRTRDCGCGAGGPPANLLKDPRWANYIGRSIGHV